LETLHFFSVLIHVSELTVVPLCITSHSLSQNVITIMRLAHREHQGAALFLLFHPSLSLPSSCSISINIAEPFMDIPHRLFHCNKDLYHSMLSVMTITGRLHFEELQQRCHVSGTFAN
jgi:hypothetical protein